MQNSFGIVPFKMTNGNTVTWQDVDAWSRDLAARLPAACGVAAFDRVVGIARGGLVPAVLVATHLDVKRIESVQVRLYDGRTKLPEPVLVGTAPSACGASGDGRQTLIVDEIVDSGETLRFLAGLYPEAIRAALVMREIEQPLAQRSGLGWRPDEAGSPSGRGVWVARGMATDRWVLFPWSPAEDRDGAEGTA